MISLAHNNGDLWCSTFSRLSLSNPKPFDSNLTLVFQNSTCRTGAQHGMVLLHDVVDAILDGMDPTFTRNVASNIHAISFLKRAKFQAAKKSCMRYCMQPCVHAWHIPSLDLAPRKMLDAIFHAFSIMMRATLQG